MESLTEKGVLCTCSAKPSSEVMALLVLLYQLEQVLVWHRNIEIVHILQSIYMATGQRIKVKFTKRSIWRSCGSCPFYLAAKVRYHLRSSIITSIRNKLTRYIDNQYGMGTSVERASASTDYYKRGQYIPGLRVYGMDVLAVEAAVRHGRDYIRSGNGPLVYEFQTYRFSGHSMSDPGIGYRSREELKAKREYDPISMLKQKLLDWETHTEEELDELEKDIRNKIKQDVMDAENMPEPEPKAETLFQDIYVRGSEPVSMRGRTTYETYYY